jgi:DNA-binding SARP family transcriptional activator/ABC-type branched-subunit amino acid transport system substrate-binding protein/streptogramin lyase
MDFKILGPLEVVDDGARVVIAPGRQRSVLGLLLLRANEVVSTDELVDALWGERPPPTAAKAVRNAVSQLRKAFAGDGRIRTHAHGYELSLEEGELDADRFAALVAEGRRALADGDAKEASTLLHAGLALWRGPPLADLTYEAFVQNDVARLAEMRLDAIEERVEADLALGRHAELVPQLERLVGEHPLRERLRRQLMLAFYRCGRQADALAVYQGVRRRLVDELGIEPSRELHELERAILNQDAALDPPTRLPLAGRRRRAGLALAAGAVLVALAAAALVFQLTGSEQPTGLVSASPNSVAVVDPDSRRLIGQVPVPGGPALVEAANGLVWIESETSRTFSVLDERTRVPRHVVIPGIPVSDIAVARDAVWLVDPRGRELVEVHPAYGEVVRRIPLPKRDDVVAGRSAPPKPAVAATANAVWVTDGSTRLLRMDTRTRRLRSVDLGVALDGVVAGSLGVWAVSGPSAVAVEIEPRTMKVLGRVPIAGRSDALAPFPTAVALGAGAVWVLNANTATVTKIDPELRAVEATISLGIERAPVDLAVGAGAVWTANRGDGTLTRIDPETGETSTVRLGQDPAGVTVGSTAVWTSVRRGLVGSVRPPGPVPGAEGTLPRSFCSPVHYAGRGRPDVLVAVPLSLQGFGAQASAQMVEAIRLVFERRDYRAGRFAVGFQACNDADRSSGFPTPERCQMNARAYVLRRRVVGVVGPVYSACSQQMLPIANAAPGGPLAMVNALNTYVGLTRRSALAKADEPDRYYPSGRRNYVRLSPGDDVQATAAAMLVQRAEVRRVFVLHERSDYGSTLATGFGRAAKASGLDVVGTASWDQAAPDFRALARRVRASGADGAFLAGAFRIGSSLLVDLRAELGPDFVLVGSDGFQIVFKEIGNLGREIEGLYITVPGTPLARLEPGGREFVHALRARIGRPPETFTVYTAAAAEVLLDAIARSNGTRLSVTRALFRTNLEDGILGPTSFTPLGDVRRNTVTVNRISGAKAVVTGVIEPRALAR